MFILSLELVLILTYFLIQLWGSKLYKIRSSFYLALFTLIGSFILLAAAVSTLVLTGHLNLICLENFHYSLDQSKLLSITWALGFSSKIPIFPLHIWLPEVHAEASSSGSIILAGIILKLGVYGLIRFDFVILSAGTKYLSPIILVLGLIGSIGASINCVRQYDIKKLLAYSSISHMNFANAGLYTLNIYGVLAALVTSYAHGLSSGALFTIAGIIYDRTQSRNVLSLQTLFNFYPAAASVIFIMTLANLSFPGSINFIGELLTLISIANIDLALTAMFSMNIFITAV